jgi:hypothetical protein
MSRPKGSNKTPGSGRKPGSRNKVTEGIREIARGFVDDPVYRAALKARLENGTAGTMETTLWAYAYGRVPVSSDEGGIPVAITVHF